MDRKVDYKTLNELLKTGNILLKIALTMLILTIGVLGLYLLEKTGILVTIGNIFGILSPLFIGIVLSWLLEPCINYFVKNKVGRKLATVTVYLILIFLIILILSLIVPEFVAQLNELIRKIPEFLTEIESFLSNMFNNFESNGLDLSKMEENALNSLNKSVNSITTNGLESIAASLTSSLKVIANIFLGLLIAFYLSLDSFKAKKYFYKFIPIRFQDDIKSLKNSLNSMLRNYVNGTLLSCLTVFILSLIGFLISGVSSPLLFAVFCAITNIIPYFGPYIGGIPVVVVGFAISPTTGIMTLIAVVLVQLLEGNIIAPLIVGKAVSLHPITIMLSLLVFEYFFGILGMILATPIVATCKILYLFFDEKYHFINKISN